MILSDNDRNQIIDMLNNIYENVSFVKEINLNIILADGSKEKLYVRR